MGYKGQGIAQGCSFDTPAGEWFAMLFQDHHAVGRIPYVLPMEWEDGWPNIGVDGKTPEEFQVNLEEEETQPLVISDTFEYTSNQLAKQWQWNHNPNNSLWSVIEHPGFLRLKTGTFAKRGFIDARNTLTQRTIGPACEIDTKLHLQGMKPGDCAGLAAIQGNFGLIGIRCHENHQYELVMCHKADEYYEEIIEMKKYLNDTIYLKIHFDFLNSVDRAYFFYSLDGERFIQFGKSLPMQYTLDHFMGYRIGLYCYATKETNGYVDFEYFNYVKYRSEERRVGKEC